MRRYEDPVEVRPRDPGPTDTAGPEGPDGAGPWPGSFLWRGRLYVVRSVLGHWRERRAWWNDAPARALHGEAVAAGSVAPAGAHVADRPTPAAEREVWRVEASAGRCAGVGVYDLRRDLGSTWSLVRVSD